MPMEYLMSRMLIKTSPLSMIGWEQMVSSHVIQVLLEILRSESQLILLLLLMFQVMHEIRLTVNPFFNYQLKPRKI